jgi:hypothetical protein
VDLLDLAGAGLTTQRFEDVALRVSEVPLDILAPNDARLSLFARERGRSNLFTRVLTFEGLLEETAFVQDVRRMLATLQEAYDYPVDVEFAANFTAPDRYRIHLLQCRPFQVRGDLRRVRMPAALAPERTLFQTSGPIIGNSVATKVDAIIYVVPRRYGRLNQADRYSVARLIGRISHLPLLRTRQEAPVLLLLGPGRWATTTPALGVPVSFAEISAASVVCEIAEMHDGLVPDISLGTHFFNDLVELDMLYLAIQPDNSTSTVNESAILGIPNALESLVPDAAAWGAVVHVVLANDVERTVGGSLVLHVDALAQRGVLHVTGPNEISPEGTDPLGAELAAK